MYLNVALYPWANDEHLDKYRRTIEHHWYFTRGNHHCRLNWLGEKDWDGGYHKTPEKHFDLFIYDRMFLDYYATQGFLCQLEHQDIAYTHEIYPNLLALIKQDKKYYGIPIYGCIYALFYRSNYVEISRLKNFDEFFSLASTKQFIVRKPSRTQ